MTMKYSSFILGLGLGLSLTLPSLGAEGSKESPVGKSFRIPYKITQTNHFLVRVRINGKGPFNFLVDTGAPALFISTHAAKAAGLEENKNDFWTEVKQFDFEGGATLTNIKGRIEDPFQLIGMNALGLPGASIDGILGFTMLARFKIELDPTKDRMIWTRLDYNPQEPWVPRTAKNRQAPAEVQAMNLLGPLAKGMAAIMGKQEPDVHLPRGGLGIILEDVNNSVKVTKVFEDSPAAKCGVKTGDVLLNIVAESPKQERRPGVLAILSLTHAQRAMNEVRPGDRLKISIRRDHNTIILMTTAGEGL
jgi:hypothetical protein